MATFPGCYFLRIISSIFSLNSRSFSKPRLNLSSNRQSVRQCCFSFKFPASLLEVQFILWLEFIHCLRIAFRAWWQFSCHVECSFVTFGCSILFSVLWRLLILVSRRLESWNSIPVARFFIPIGCLNALVDASVQSFMLISFTVFFQGVHMGFPFERVTRVFQIFDTFLVHVQRKVLRNHWCSHIHRFPNTQVQLAL